MVSSKEHSSIYDIKISTVAPGKISARDAFQELTALDLAMKLHYLRFVYYFKTPTFDGFTITDIKETMFDWLNHAYIPCGRFRRTDSGRPIIKCNDSGARFIEAKCHLSLDEWLECKDDSGHKLLVPNNVIGPDLPFSPLVMIKFTKFKCGATSVGLSWSHVLGDAFSAMTFIRLWTQVIAGHNPEKPITMAQSKTHMCSIRSPNPRPSPQSLKQIGSVGDFWSTSSSNLQMETFSFHISMSELTRLQKNICQEKSDPLVPLFECICTVIWDCLGKIRRGTAPQVVTVCKSDLRNRTKETITNKSQTIGVVKTDIQIVKSTPIQLGLLMTNHVVDERMKIEEAMESNDTLLDFLIYGANLTFVDLSDTTLYEIEVRGQNPVYVSCAIDNIGDEGVVLVLPTPKGCDGRKVSITLPINEVADLKAKLKEDWFIA